MVFTVRLDEKTEELLDRLARIDDLSRSEVVRRSIQLLAEQRMAREEESPFEAVKHLIGSVRGGPPRLSEQTGKQFRELMTRKKARRR